MGQYGRTDDLISLVVNPGSFLPDLPLDKVRLLQVEAQSMREEYSRDIVINYLSGNFSSNPHLCRTVLNGKDDKSILELLDLLDMMISEELLARKNNGLPTY